MHPLTYAAMFLALPLLVFGVFAVHKINDGYNVCLTHWEGKAEGWPGPVIVTECAFGPAEAPRW